MRISDWSSDVCSSDLEQIRTGLAAGADVVNVTDPLAPGAAAVSADGQTAYLDVTYDLEQLTSAQLDDAMAVTDTASADGLQVELTGALALLAPGDPSSALIGVGVAILVLLVAFVSVVAMGLQIATALLDRQSVVEGRSGHRRVDIGG